MEPRLASEQVADVLVRSARQTEGTGWNERTGSGVVDGAAATRARAHAYDVTPPRKRGRARRRDGTHVAVRLSRASDRTARGRELAGHLTYSVLVSRDGGRSYAVAVRKRKPLRRVIRLKGSKLERRGHRRLRPQRQLRDQAAGQVPAPVTRVSSL